MAGRTFYTTSLALSWLFFHLQKEACAGSQACNWEWWTCLMQCLELLRLFFIRSSCAPHSQVIVTTCLGLNLGSERFGHGGCEQSFDVEAKWRWFRSFGGCIILLILAFGDPFFSVLTSSTISLFDQKLWKLKLFILLKIIACFTASCVWLARLAMACHFHFHFGAHAAANPE